MSRTPVPDGHKVNIFFARELHLIIISIMHLLYWTWLFMQFPTSWCPAYREEELTRNGEMVRRRNIDSPISISNATQEMKGFAGEQESDMKSFAICVKILCQNMQEKLERIFSAEVKNILLMQKEKLLTNLCGNISKINMEA